MSFVFFPIVLAKNHQLFGPQKVQLFQKKVATFWDHLEMSKTGQLFGTQKSCNFFVKSCNFFDHQKMEELAKKVATFFVVFQKVSSKKVATFSKKVTTFSNAKKSQKTSQLLRVRKSCNFFYKKLQLFQL